MKDEFEVIDEMDTGDVTPEQIEVSKQVFQVMMPVIPNLLDELQKIDSEIAGAILICWRPGQEGAIITGNSPPSATVPYLKKVLGDMLGEDREFIEAAFAKSKAKSN